MVDSQLQEIKDRLDIVEVLSGYLRLSKAGRNFKAPCPFHSEKTPSFVVSPERQIWHCFGCGQGGDIFTFVMKIEGMEFPEALRHLAEKAGVELKRANYEASGAKAKILEINRVVKNFFQEQLVKTEAGRAAKKYLLGRGLTERSIGNFEIGYSPDEWNSTENFLIARGFAKKDIFSSGITAQSERQGGSFYDRFRGRIMFPILDIAGHTVGFGGRSFARKDGDEAKYINTPESMAYSKSRVLYGLNFAREHIRKSDNCILVEGYMDVIGSHQMGVANAVSTSGTALTSEQLKIIKRYASKLILSFDGDSAGQEATSRSIDLVLAAGFDVKVVILPPEKDPSDFVANPVEWKNIVRKAMHVMDFYFKNAFAKNDPAGLEGKKNISEELLAVIAKIPSGVEQAHWIGVLAERLSVDAKVLMEDLKKMKTGVKSAKPASSGAAGSGFLIKNTDELEGYFLALLVTLPNAGEHIKKIEEHRFIFTNPDFKKIYEMIKTFSEECLRRGDLMLELKKRLPSDMFQNLSEMALKAEYYYEIGKEEKEAAKPFEELLKRLVCRQCEVKQKVLERDIKIAEKNKDSGSIKLFMKELADVSQKKEKLTK